MKLVRDCMFPNVVTLAPHATLLDAMRRMTREAAGFAVVLENMEIIGLITEYDCIKWMIQGIQPEQERIGSLPVSVPQIVHESTPCQELLQIYYRRRFRRFPVLNEDEMLSGGITEKQILRAFPRSNLLAHYRVADMIAADLPAIAPDLTFWDIARQMAQRHRGCVLVRTGEQFLGMITEGDMLRFRISAQWNPATTAAALAQARLASIEPEQDLLEALDLFTRTGHRRMPVVTAAGRLVGLLTQTDLLRQVAHSTRSRQAILNPEDIAEPAIWFEPHGDHRILAINEKGARAMELNPAEWVGRPVTTLSQDPAVWGAIATLLASSGHINQINLPLRTGSGSSVCLSCRFKLVHTPAGEDRIFWAMAAPETGRDSCH
ncbi:MAG: CBS domain-containing protein [Magnetococcales bacterium]|nr:CBS domain-containing protein [Magnetococcales bacterium]NGZ05400.1 CBS domain-containing protein [Magnetococcales bacterium]